ncbi:hypothetical protein EV360DRAFT_73208 [Lentinula raphanica]|nr:hypothetical protein EV360DRAFT_73208 [Lentinula raphanica]
MTTAMDFWSNQGSSPPRGFDDEMDQDGSDEFNGIATHILVNAKFTSFNTNGPPTYSQRLQVIQAASELDLTTNCFEIKTIWLLLLLPTAAEGGARPLRDYFYRAMAAKFSEFRFCNNGKWKARLYAIGKYPDWKRDYRDKGKLRQDAAIEALRLEIESKKSLYQISLPPKPTRANKRRKLNTVNSEKESSGRLVSNASNSDTSDSANSTSNDPPISDLVISSPSPVGDDSIRLPASPMDVSTDPKDTTDTTAEPIEQASGARRDTHKTNLSNIDSSLGTENPDSHLSPSTARTAPSASSDDPAMLNPPLKSSNNSNVPARFVKVWIPGPFNTRTAGTIIVSSGIHSEGQSPVKTWNALSKKRKAGNHDNGTQDYHTNTVQWPNTCTCLNGDDSFYVKDVRTHTPYAERERNDCELMRDKSWDNKENGK